MASRNTRKLVGYGAAVVGSGAVVGLLLLLSGAFHRKTPEARATSIERLVGSATVVEVRTLAHVRRETAVGTVKPVHEAAIASKLLARVVDVSVNAGQIVKQGEVLVRLDDVRPATHADGGVGTRVARVALARRPVGRGASRVAGL